MKFLITDSVPLNGGDEAMLWATCESIRARWPEAEITVLCHELELCRSYLPGFQTAAGTNFVSTSYDCQKTSDLYRGADVVLSAPGGFLHDWYDFEDRLRGFDFALTLGKPLILLPQSIGPFWKPESIKRISSVLNRASLVCVRDHASTRALLECGVDPAKILEAADISFLWRQLAPELFHARKRPVRKIGLNFRAWPQDDGASLQEIIGKAAQLCRFLLSRPDRELVFISTCQGVPRYIDDSLVAAEILQQLPYSFQQRCQINDRRYATRELIEALGKFDAFIGMRLHGCLLAMLGGTPSMGLGYETKTAEIFGQLNLESYQLSFRAPEPQWLRCAEHFLADAECISHRLPPALGALAQKAATSLDAIENFLPRPGSTSSKFSAVGGNKDLTIALPPTVSETIEAIEKLVASGVPFIFVDEDHWRNDLFPTDGAIPFMEKDGQYWGPPLDDAAAITEFERLHNSGASYIVFAAHAFWWLEYYAGFGAYLRAKFSCVLQNEILVVFDLRPNRQP